MRLQVDDHRTNRHPADELAEVRTAIKSLEARECTLRALLIGADHSLVGELFEARVSTQKRKRLDLAAALKELGAERLRPFMKTTESTMVKLVGRAHGKP